MGVFRNCMLVPALLAGMAAAGPVLAQSSGQSPNQTLMQERQGAIGTPGQPDGGDAPKQAVQGSGNAGAGAGSAEDEARAAIGVAPPSGSLQFGETGSNPSLPANRQGTIGTGEKPPEPTVQGGADQGGKTRQ
jgi:hypothetical protein